MARRVLFFGISLLLSASGLRAQSSTPVFTDAIVVTATGEEQPVAATPAAVTVITEEEIAARGSAAAADLLRSVPGTTLLRSGLDNNVASLFVRGTASTQTLVLFDGVRLSSPFFGGYDWSLPLAVGLERLEVARGPFSALYGGDAVGGVVQLIPSRPTATRLRMLAEGGADAWRRGELEASLRIGDLGVLVAGGHREGNGELANDDFKSRSMMADARYEVGSGRIGVLVRHTESSTAIPFADGRVTPNRRTEAQESLAAVPLRFALGAGVELDATLSHVARELAFRDPDDPWGFTASDTEAASTAGVATVRGRWGGHRLAVGGEWRRDAVTDASSYGPNLDGRTLETRSAFVQDTFGLGRGVTVVAGARWDEADPWGSELSPRVTVAWETGAVQSWLAYGEAFRPPGLGDLYYPFFGNPELVPEHSASFEAGTRLALGRHGTTAEIVGFSNRVDDMIDFDYAAQRSANIARAAQDGVELILHGVHPRARSRLSLTWLDARDGSGEPLRRRAEWTSSLLVYGPALGRSEAALEVVWVGERTDIHPITFAPVTLGGFVTSSASIAFPLAEGLRVRLRAENLADREYQEVAGYPAPRRRVMAGVETVLD